MLVDSIKHHWKKHDQQLGKWGRGRKGRRDNQQVISSSKYWFYLYDHIYYAQDTVFGTTWAVKTQMSSAFTKTLPSYSGERTHHYMTTEHWLKTTNQQRQVLFKLVSRKAKDKTGIWTLRGPMSLPPFLRWRAVV